MTIEIRSTHYPHDMAAWLVEKSQNILQDLVRLHEDIRNKGASTELTDTIEDYLGPIFWDCTKILSFACGAQWSTTDRDEILANGKAGLEEVLVKYGLLNRTAAAKRKEDWEGFLRRLRELLGGSRYPSRTLINDLLAETEIRHPLFSVVLDEISRLTDKLNMGEASWAEYVSRVSELIRPFEARPGQDTA